MHSPELCGARGASGSCTAPDCAARAVAHAAGPACPQPLTRVVCCPVRALQAVAPVGLKCIKLHKLTLPA